VNGPAGNQAAGALTPGRLDALSGGRDNNFNLLRMLAAAGVLVSHAYPLTRGPGAAQPLEGVLGGITLGTVCVYVFFAISGFFIAQSFERSATVGAFLRARALRLFPALAVVLGVTVLVAGFWLTDAPPPVYWAAVPEYLVRNVTLFFLRYDLPGVFEGNPYGPAINGSLWTLNYEVLCYTGVFLAGVAGLLRRPAAMALLLALFAAACAVAMQVPVPIRVRLLLELGLPFAVGTAFYIWRDRIVLSLPVAAALVLGAAAVRAIPALEPAFRPVLVLALSYAVFVAGHLPGRLLRSYNRLGDYSYGTYIYAFPVQQLVAFWGVTVPLANIAAALPLTLLCAVLSWHLVERPALRLKARPPRPAVADLRP
jgi:peptidoglycan/LPS O-acetylase OafA/YrhL